MPARSDGFDVETVKVDGTSSAVRKVFEVGWTAHEKTESVPVDRRLVIGSAPDVDIRLDDATVSRIHAALEPTDDGLWITDLGSRNGTFVNGLRIARAEAPPEASIRLGRAVLTIGSARQPLAVSIWRDDDFFGLRGKSAAMGELFARLARVAADDATVLVSGETGTGKDLIAHAIHAASPRASAPLVIVDCGAIPANLIESELFGYARGAFTGAATARAGAFESADGGTLFLDEIGELPLALQPTLLRVIESRSVRRIGETAPRAVNIRIVCATHRDLATMVNLGAFREDLYFRLAVVPVRVPPLRERREDIPLLLERFLPPGTVLARDEVAQLVARPWLGNVRELRNFADVVRVLGVPEALAGMVPVPASSSSSPARASDSFPPVSIDRPFKEVKDEWTDHFEREYIRLALARHERNVTAVADASGLDRAWVYRLIRKHGL